jgi:lipopolysaccharide/colanic/teichoic acid biosynthesis glycosyltransferase
MQLLFMQLLSNRNHLVPAELPNRSASPTLSPWCFSEGKRALDVSVSMLALIPALPLMLFVAIAVKLRSTGPVFFRHKRLGKGGTEFSLLKFRTMYHDPSQIGLALTARGDVRVTSIGRVLRKWKLDELPQLFNVLRGNMTLVGPRPDSPKYLASLSAEQRAVLSLTPGITSPASLQFRDEETLLATVSPHKLEQFYVDHVLPRKVDLELEYAAKANLLGDTLILLRTVTTVLYKKHRRQVITSTRQL